MGMLDFLKKKKPTEKDSINFNTVELGDSGNVKLSGSFYDEYNTALLGREGTKQYEEMRSGDATVMATLLAMELPVRSTKWYIEAGTTNGEISPQDEKIKEFVEKAIFEKMSISFDDILRQSLTMLPFGFSVFEKVYKLEDGAIYIDKIAMRMQQSISEWQTEEGEPGITQELNTDDKPLSLSIPAEKLVIFSYRKEGDNPEGRSALRSAYKHWYYKDNLYSFEGVKHERQSVGIPVITLPKGASDKDKREAETILKNLRSTEQSYVVLPNEDWKLEFVDLKGSATTDPMPIILHHDRQIAKNVLAQFLDLGKDGGGSHALSKDQSSLFTLSLTALAKQVSEVWNIHIIKQLVNFNFNIGENQTYPILNYEKIGDVDFKELTDALDKIIKAGVVTTDEELEDHMRDTMDLPKKVRDGKQIEKKEPTKKPVEKKEDNSKEKNQEKESKEKFTIEAITLEFAEVTNIKPEVATKIVKMLHKRQKIDDTVSVIDIGLIISDLIWKLKREVDIIALLNKATDEKIEEVINDLVKRRDPGADYPKRLDTESYTDLEKTMFKEYQEVKAFSTIFNTKAILDVQKNDK